MRTFWAEISMPARVEGDLEAGPELAGHLPLLEGAGLGHQADPDAVGAEGAEGLNRAG